METYQPTYDFGPGKENYGKIAKAFDDAFGLPYKGMYRFWRNPAQFRAFSRLLNIQASGVIPLVHHFATNPDGSPVPTDDWPEVSIPSFGPFTGAQHEFGGNMYLAAACQLDGIDDVDLSYWLLWGAYKRNPAVFDPDVPHSYFYNWAHPPA